MLGRTSKHGHIGAVYMVDDSC